MWVVLNSWSYSKIIKKILFLLIELMFAQIAFTSIVYPSLILAYMGQAAYLSKHHVVEEDYKIGFYVSVPGRYFELLR